MKQLNDEATHLSQATTNKLSKTSKAKKRQKESKKMRTDFSATCGGKLKLMVETFFFFKEKII